MNDDDAVIGGNQRPVQVRKVRKGGFTVRKKQVFLDHLAACCNVTRAAAAAGVSTVTINYHRRRDPEFAEAAAQALAAGCEMLESLLMERAAGGGAGYEPGGTAASGPETVDTGLALHLMQLRQRPMGERTGRGGQRPKRADEKALAQSILAKLDVLEKRRKAKGGRRKPVGEPERASPLPASLGPGLQPAAEVHPERRRHAASKGRDGGA